MRVHPKLIPAKNGKSTQKLSPDKIKNPRGEANLRENTNRNRNTEIKLARYSYLYFTSPPQSHLEFFISRISSCSYLSKKSPGCRISTQNTDKSNMIFPYSYGV